MIRPYNEYDELYHKYFEGQNTFIIKTPYKLYSLYHIGEEEEGYDVSAILSSNYQDLYIIFTGAIEFTLPHKVDAKSEWNCNINDNNIISKYKLTLNKNKPETTSLEFIKRSIENLEDDYIVLTKEFDLNFFEHRTDNYSFDELDDEELSRISLLSNQNQSIITHKYKPNIARGKKLSIYFAFPVPDFMVEWHQVELKSNYDYPLDKRSFKYPWQEYKYQFPCVLTVYRKNPRNSPILGAKMNPNHKSINKPSKANPPKKIKVPTIDPSLRPPLEVAPPIDFQDYETQQSYDFLSPTGNLPEDDSVLCTSAKPWATSLTSTDYVVRKPEGLGRVATSGPEGHSEIRIFGDEQEQKETKKPIQLPSSILNNTSSKATQPSAPSSKKPSFNFTINTSQKKK